MSHQDEEIVLVVDDTPASRYASKRILEGAAMRVIEAASGRECMAKVRDAKPVLIVLDVKLPDASGFDIARRLRAMPETSHIQILHLSATYLNAEDRVAGLEAGADGYLTSPVEPIVLVATVRALLRAGRAERERRRLNHALARSEARAKRLADSNLLGVVYLDDDGATTWSNQAFAPLAPHARPLLALVAEKLREQADVPLFEHTVDRADGERVDTLVGASRFDAQSPAGVAMVLDVTRRRKAETDLREALRVRDEMLAVASHDLRSPLQALQLRIEQLLRHGADVTQPVLQERMAKMKAHVVRIGGMLNDLLDMSSLSAGRVSLKLEEVDLASVVKETVERMRDQLAQVGSSVRIDVAGPILGRWDPLRLEQVVENLLSNAIKYGAGKPVSVQIGASSGRARLVVRDQGIGISEADQARIFDRFSRVRAERSSGSYGLGLWIVKRISEAMGGTVRVDSAPGKGAQFTVELPGVPSPVS